MQFDAIEAGSDGIFRAVQEVADDTRHFVGAQRARRRRIGMTTAAVVQIHERGVLRIARHRSRAGADRLAAVGLQRGV
ncbi:hypothetical protein D3C75_987530 [compost metagenome]